MQRTVRSIAPNWSKIARAGRELVGRLAHPALERPPASDAGTHRAKFAAVESLSRSAIEIARPFGFPITNSMAVSWVVALGLIVFAQFATRNMKQVPDGP